MNFAENLLQATNWDPQAWGPPIEATPGIAPRAKDAQAVLALPVSAEKTISVSEDANQNNRYDPYPFWRRAIVIAQPAVSPTASTGTNSWDWKYGLVGSPIAPITSSNKNLPVAPVPTMGM